VDELLSSEWCEACSLLETAITTPNPSSYFEVRARWGRVEETVLAFVGDTADAHSMAGDEVPYHRALAARDPSVPAEALEVLATDPNRIVRLSVAANPATPPAALARLYHDGCWHIRVELAGNASVPGWMTAFLASDRSPFVRAAIAGSPATPPAIVSRLGTDVDWRVRAAVTRNPTASPKLLRRLLEDDDSVVVGGARAALRVSVRA
jgi:hypothetical protein